MPRNFGVRRNLFGAELFAEPASDTERDPIWPFVLIGAVLAMILGVGILMA